ncbi:GAF domain-containing protein [Planctobacterium marinum]|uniref:histidine kinase n=1 Tax=Planctobacterium marinum TaxID=1631968 RepID=A0AA48HR17_9ALTE|nr:hypothetical protein MACH26_26430 [Planctobacterium marinum]
MSEIQAIDEEQERVKIVRDLAILNTPAEPEFDEVVRFAGELCETRYVFLTLVDSERLWFKSKLGLDICEIQREISICNHTLLNNCILEIEDARKHPVFCDNPLVKSDLSIRFYVGIPLRLKSDIAIGTLCVMDDKPKVLSDVQKKGLLLMAKQIVHLLESRSNKKLAQLEVEKNRETEKIINAIACVNRDYLNGVSTRALVSDFLKAFLTITDSQFGFIAEVLSDKNKQPYLKHIALADVSKDSDTADYFNSNPDSELEFHNLDTLFGAVIRTGKALISNDAKHHPQSGGTPSGHPSLKQFAGFPLFREGEMVGMVGLANRESGYDERILQFVEPLLDNCSLIVKAYRSEMEKDAFLSALESEKQAFKKLSDKFSSLYHSLDDGIVECSVPDGKILDCNPAFCKMIGYDKQSLCNLTIFDITDSASLQQSEIKLAESISEKGESEAFEKHYIHSHGHPVPALVKVFKVNTNPAETPRAWGLIKDLSVQQKREMQRAQRKKMESLGTLSGGIAHDFNNILAIISGNAELLKMTQANKELLHHTCKILDASQRGAELVKRILAFSRKNPQSHSAIDLKKAIEQALELIQPTISTNISLRVDLQDSGMISSDESSVTQLLMNLISNACQAIEPNTGTIEIKLCEISGHHADPLQLRLTVSDTGRGMSQLQTSQAFDPFYTTKEKGRGTGLGLAIVHGLVEDMKAHIHIDSQEGIGSNVTIDIPVSHPGIVHQAHRAESPEFERHKVLVVEDETEIAQLYMEALQADGHEVFTAENGEQAWHLFEQHDNQFDIVISDDQMPIMRGIDLAKRIKMKCPDIPVVLLSGFISQYIEEAQAKGDINLILTKPIALDELRNTIKQFKVIKTRCC